MTRAITTLGGIGHLRPAPGTWASAAAVGLAVLLHGIAGFWGFFAATLAVGALGYWAVRREVGETSEDPAHIVIDEVLGQWIALWPVSFGAMVTDSAILALYPGLIVAFLAFRALDILKPGPIGWADRQPGAFGIMADDAIAGWIAGMIVVLLAVVAHGIAA